MKKEVFIKYVFLFQILTAIFMIASSNVSGNEFALWIGLWGTLNIIKFYLYDKKQPDYSIEKQIFLSISGTAFILIALGQLFLFN